MNDPTPVPPPVTPAAAAAATPAEAAAPALPPAAPPTPAAPGERCPNCSAPLHGPFCYSCGQSKKGLIRHFSSIMGDFLDSVLQIDNRTWRTLGPLYFKPGYLSNEYFAGRRVRYVTPLRLYFFLSLVAFLVISLVTDIDARIDEKGNLAIGSAPPQTEQRETTPGEREKILRDLDEGLKFVPESQREKIREEVRRDLERQSDAAGDKAAAQAEAADATADAERIAKAVEEAKRDEEENEPDINFDGTPWHRTKHPLTFSWLPDAANDALNEEIEVLVRKIRRVKDDPGPFVKQIFSTAPQTLFVILPIFALLLKIFFIFKRRLYMEHLIVALHSHSFICFSLILLVLLDQVRDALGAGFFRSVLDWVFGLSCAWIPLYLLLMQKRVYKQNWIFTLFKYGLIGIAYLFLLTFGTLLTMLVSLVLL